MSVWCHVVITLTKEKKSIYILKVREQAIKKRCERPQMLLHILTVYTTDSHPTLIWNMAAPSTWPA